MKSRLKSAALAALAATLLPLSANALDVQVDDTFGGMTMTWATNSTTLIRYRPVMHEGEMYICGAYSNNGGNNITRVGREVVREATIKMEGSTVMRNLDFFNVVSSANNSNGLVGTTASCRSTGLAPTNAQFSTVEIFIRGGRYTSR